MRLDPRTHSKRLVKTLLWTLTGFTLLILIFIIADIFMKGLPQVTPGSSPGSHRHGPGRRHLPHHRGHRLYHPPGHRAGLPLGVGTAIYLTEYTREGWATRIIRFGAECLAGVPSIILGLFGFVLFVYEAGLRLVGALRRPHPGHHGATHHHPHLGGGHQSGAPGLPHRLFSLGMSQWQTVTRIVLPSALPGITTGIMLSIGRSLGETAVLLFTAGAALRTPVSVFDSGRTMAVHFYILAREGISMPNAYGTAAVLVISILRSISWPTP